MILKVGVLKKVRFDTGTYIYKHIASSHVQYEEVGLSLKLCIIPLGMYLCHTAQTVVHS